jgi:hypothetical protein
MKTRTHKIKQLLGDLPLTAETYWYLRQQGKPVGGLHLTELKGWLPEWRQAASSSPIRSQAGKRVFLFATLGYWLQHSTLLGLSLAALGHDVTLAYLPYGNWRKRVGRFDLRMQNAYVRSVLNGANPLVKVIPWFESGPDLPVLSTEMLSAVERVAEFDVMYTDQVENVDRTSALYHLRLERNSQAAAQAIASLNATRPDLVIVPNGSILEFGAVYQAARSLSLPVVTYEFGEQRGRIWFDLNKEVMQQDTDALWAAYQDQPLGEMEWEKIRELYASRQKASLWENFSRRWQDVPSEGSEAVRTSLGLDKRPLVLLPANVIGDSLTLGRQVFSQSMTEWLVGTVDYFRRVPQVQLVVRIHPGERYTTGASVADVIRQSFPNLPGHIHLVAHDAPVNTYDLIQAADLGLVYTTTVGLEMVMSGVPVITAGQTHYRGRGFTLDPESWDEYYENLDRAVVRSQQHRLTRHQVEQAWNYAYRFFFSFPLPFPWHLLYMPEDTRTWPLGRVLSEEGQNLYAEAFQGLTGIPRRWQVGEAAVNGQEQHGD